MLEKISNYVAIGLVGLIMGVAGYSFGEQIADNTPIPGGVSPIIGEEFCREAGAIDRIMLLRETVEGDSMVPRYRVNKGLDYVDWTDYPGAPEFNPVGEQNGEPVEVSREFAECVRERYVQ